MWRAPSNAAVDLCSSSEIRFASLAHAGRVVGAESDKNSDNTAYGRIYISLCANDLSFGLHPNIRDVYTVVLVGLERESRVGRDAGFTPLVTCA